jgi:AcrR family transcriptional regulator
MKRTRSEADKTIDKLLDSALKLFCEKGYSAVSMEMIAAGAALTRGALYHSFSSKEAVLAALIARERESFEGSLQELYKLKAAPDEHLSIILDHILLNFFGNRRFNRFIRLTWFRIEYGILEKSFLYQGRANRNLLRNFSSIIRSGQKGGDFSRAVNADTAAAGLLSMILGLYRYHYQDKKFMSLPRARKMFDLYLSALKN